MKTGLLLVSAVVLCALSTGCARVNLARNGCGSCQSCSAKAGGCDQAACTGVASAGPAGVAAMGPAGVAGASPYDPGMAGPYAAAGGHGGHGGRGGYGGPGMGGAYGGPPSAQVAYPYYTTRGPRDFLINNPPSIGY